MKTPAAIQVVLRLLHMYTFSDTLYAAYDLGSGRLLAIIAVLTTLSLWLCTPTRVLNSECIYRLDPGHPQLNRLLLSSIAVALGFTAGTIPADENPSGFYLGVGAGQFNVQIDDVTDVDEAVERLDDDDTAYKGFVGWRFSPYIALELAYLDLGEVSSNDSASGSSGDYRLKLAGFAPYVIGTLPLGPVEASGKVGYYFYDVDLKIDIDAPLSPDFDASSSDEDLMYGLGLGMTFFDHLNARVEYEWIDSDLLDDADALWGSVTWRF